MGSGFQNRLLAGFAVSILLLAGIGYAALGSLSDLTASAERVAHTQKVLGTARAGLTQLLNAETGQRGYLLTGDKSFLVPFDSARNQASPTFKELRRLVDDNPVSSSIADSLLFYSNLRLYQMDATINDRQATGSIDAAVDKAMLDKGKMYMDNARRLVAQLEAEENQLLAIRQEANEAGTFQTRVVIAIGMVLVLLVVLILFYYIQSTFRKQKEAEQRIQVINIDLEKVSQENIYRNWLLDGINMVNEQLRGDKDVNEIGEQVLLQLVDYNRAAAGVFYIYNDTTESLELLASTGVSRERQLANVFMRGEGLLGKAAGNKKAVVLRNVPDGYSDLKGALGGGAPSFILWKAFYMGNDLKGVVELCYAVPFEERYQEVLELVGENIAIALQAAQARKRTIELLEEVQQQSEELQSQQEELRVTNDELMKQSEMLQASEEELRVQQEELRQVNAELEEKATLLEEKNQVVQDASSALEQKASELEQTSKYKSEFLANMSHELRTPLNSILLLAKMLEDNQGQRLNKDEVKFASVIHTAGQDLLNLINDILDLSKIEAGKIDLYPEQLNLFKMQEGLRMLFENTAASKNVNFLVKNNCPPELKVVSDQVRIEQIVKNLLSNAFKFTPEKGTVTLHMDVTQHSGKGYLVIAVEDTGIGIAPEKQRPIFEAFQQADGSTSRKYGGTGLGLSISRELASLLGGYIDLRSEVGKGSTFSLHLPLEYEGKMPEADTHMPIPSPFDTHIETPKLDNNYILLIEDDPNFRRILYSQSRNRGFIPLEAATGALGIEMAKQYVPGAIILDLGLPDMDGWDVLKMLKQDEITAAIPVHIMSARDEKKQLAAKRGAIGYLHKPVNQEQLNEVFNSFPLQNMDLQYLLLVEDHATQSFALKSTLEAKGIMVSQAFTGEEALSQLEQALPDGIILDLNLPDISGFTLLEKISSRPDWANIPVIIHTGMELDAEQLKTLARYDNTLVLKSGKSGQRLLDEVQLFMHRIRADKDKGQVSGAKSQPVVKDGLQDKKILLTDDDMRNVFALSAVLQQHGMKIEIAGNGREAIEKLEQHPDIDLVLMDVMMPEMDGLEATRIIRSKEKWAGLPVIALTAKAMKQDREQCLEAGASDYASKPVDTDKLLNLMQVWLSK